MSNKYLDNKKIIIYCQNCDNLSENVISHLLVVSIIATVKDYRNFTSLPYSKLIHIVKGLLEARVGLHETRVSFAK